MVEGWPIVFLSHKLINLVNAKVAGQKIVLVMVNQLCSNSFRYK